MNQGGRIVLVSSAWLACSVLQLTAQSCPPEDGSLRPGELTTVIGTIRNHKDLRGWIGLQVSHPVCGQKELQLTFINDDNSARYRTVRALDACKAKVTGRIDYAPTGYYSTVMFIEDGKIEPEALCRPAREKPDLSKAPIPLDLQSYKGTLTLNFADSSKPMRGAVSRTDGEAETLTPWEAYVDPMLNGGGDVLWVSCRDGFHLNDAYTEVGGKRAKPEEWLNKEAPSLSSPDKPGPSSITITCVKDSDKSHKTK